MRILRGGDPSTEECPHCKDTVGLRPGDDVVTFGLMKDMFYGENDRDKAIIALRAKAKCAIGMTAFCFLDLNQSFALCYMHKAKTLRKLYWRTNGTIG